MAKKAKEPKPKIPKTLKAILDNAKKTEQPPPDNHGVAAILGKGIAAAAMEVGTGQTAAVLTDAGEVRSMTTPFGRPQGEPLLRPEGETPFDDKYEEAWGGAAGLPKEPIEPDAPEFPEEPEEAPEADPFAELPVEKEAITPEQAAHERAFPTIVGDGEPDASEMLEEMADLRKTNQELRELIGEDHAEMIGRLQEDNRTLAAQLLDEQSRPEGAGGLPKWEGKDLRILFPCHKTTNPATAMFLVAMALDFGAEKIGFIPGIGDARIANMRNRLADQFLKTEANWALFLDDDMIPTVGRPQMIRDFIGVTPEEVPDAVLNVHVIKRLMGSGHKLIGATYFGRRRYSPAMFKDGIDNRAAYNEAKNHTGAIIPTEWVATGCLLIHRDVFLGIQKACPELAPTGRQKYWDFFQEGRGEEEGEDVMFCKRAKKAGFQPYVDTGAQAFHCGYMCFGFHNTINILIKNGTPNPWSRG